MLCGMLEGGESWKIESKSGVTDAKGYEVPGIGENHFSAKHRNPR